MSKLTGVAAFALCAFACFGYEPQSHTATFTTNGITYAQRGGLGAADFVVTNIDANAVGKVKSVNGKTGDVSLDASDVGAATAAQGAKADAALSRAEAEAGFTEWRPFRPDSGYSLISATYNNGQWTIVVLFDGASEPTTYTLYGSPTETILTFHSEYDSLIRTRLPTMADIPTIPAKWALSNVTNATGGAVAAADVRGIGIDYIAFPFETGRDYYEGDVVTINDKFYRFNQRWRHQWGDDPIGNECVDELTDFAKLGGAVFAQQFLTLGWGGTNAPSYKMVNAGFENGRNTYFTISPSGIGFEDEYGGEFRMVADQLRYRDGNTQYEKRIRDLLTTDNTLPMSEYYFAESFKKQPTSPYYIYTFLTNNYLTAFTVNTDFLKKSDASSTYLSQTDAANTYATPSDVASKVSTAIANAQIQYLYNNYGNIRMRYDGVLQRQTHTGYNVNFTNEQSGVVLLWNGANNWKAYGTQIGDITVTRSDGVVVCTEFPMVRYTEDYPNTTVWQLSPLGTFRAVPNAYGSLSWNTFDTLAKESEVVKKNSDNSIYINNSTDDRTVRVGVGSGGALNISTYQDAVETAVTVPVGKQGDVAVVSEVQAVEATVPNNITRTATDATLVHCDSGNCTNALVYIRQATSALAGLMTAADKVAFDAMKTTVSNHETAIQTVTNDNAQTRQIVTTWENFLDGSNVVFSITNYISGAYNLDAAKLRVLELRDGAYNEVYNSRDEILLHIDNFKTNDFRVATNQVIGAVNAAIENKADKNWGKYTSAGGEAPENTVYMTAPNTVFAGGLEYERVAVGQGAVCVLTTRGAPVWTQGDEGTFKFQDDGGTNFFGFAKTDSYTIGANTDGITVQSGMVMLTYNITMSGRPCVWYKADLTSTTPWEQLNLPDGSPVAGASHSVTWEQNPPAGTQVCYINVGSQPQGFFRATVEVAGEAKFMTNMKADLSGGIMCTNTATGVMGVIKPTFNGTTVQWIWSAN